MASRPDKAIRVLLERPSRPRLLAALQCVVATEVPTA